MMLDAEPDEGDIPAAGRTYRGAFKPWNKEALTGIQLLLGNLSSSQVRGARMLIGISSNGNSDHLPTNNGVVNNVITGNARTGWVQVTIGGANDLPVRADANGTGLAWTDLVSFSPALQANEDVDIVWRIWLPPRNTARYARTFSGGRDDAGNRLSASGSLIKLRRELLGTSDWWKFGAADSFGRADGNFVTNLAATASWVVTPNPGGTFGAYGKDYISAIPILGYRFKATRNVPLIEFVGDSITQGYEDKAVGDLVIGLDGMSGRMLRAWGVGSNASYSVVNFGQSGFTPEEYLARWKGLARADPNGATAMVYSIYSPNGFAGPGVMNQARIDQMKQATLDAEAAAKSLGRTFIPAFITGTNYFLLQPCPDMKSWCGDSTGLVKNLLDWAKQRYGNQLLDLHDAIADKTTIGPAMQGGLNGVTPYTDDQTHPNTAGYDALGARLPTLFPGVYNNARQAQAVP